MQFYHNIENDQIINVGRFYKRQQLIDLFKKRFSTYGYNEIATSNFETYDLYATMNGTVNHHEMIKTIDNTGQVLVLRPDITIPITQKIALTQEELQEELRYFYILDVFRQATEHQEARERTQAGVEYFGNESPEADAEIIALAVHTLKDLTIENFKIELGHSGFFKQVMKELNLASHDENELKRFIEAKNVTGLEPFLNRLNIADDLQTIIKAIPFLYGDSDNVIRKAKLLPLTDEMREKLDNLAEIYSILESYKMDNHVVIDLGLINHMDYYSDMIFQGFIERVARPVLMGGRYDNLADEFDTTLPAIGFACDIDLVLEGTPKDRLPSLKIADVAVLYEASEQESGLQLAHDLRDEGFRVLTYPTAKDAKKIPKSIKKIVLTQENKQLKMNEENHNFTTIDQLYEKLKETRERK